VGIDDVKVKVVNGELEALSHTFEGHTLKLNVSLDSDAPGDSSVDSTISIGPWSTSASVTNSGWEQKVIFPAGTYQLTATPSDTSTGFSAGSSLSAATSDTEETVFAATIGYTVTAPTTASVTVTVQDSNNALLVSKNLISATLSPGVGTCESATDASGQIECTGLTLSETYSITVTWNNGTKDLTNSANFKTNATGSSDAPPTVTLPAP
jgi:hypothetical protein